MQFLRSLSTYLTNSKVGTSLGQCWNDILDLLQPEILKELEKSAVISGFWEFCLGTKITDHPTHWAPGEEGGESLKTWSSGTWWSMIWSPNILQLDFILVFSPGVLGQVNFSSLCLLNRTGPVLPPYFPHYLLSNSSTPPPSLLTLLSGGSSSLPPTWSSLGFSRLCLFKHLAEAAISILCLADGEPQVPHFGFCSCFVFLHVFLYFGYTGSSLWCTGSEVSWLSSCSLPCVLSCRVCVNHTCILSCMC